MSSEPENGRIAGHPPVGIDADDAVTRRSMPGVWLRMAVGIVGKTVLHSIAYITVVGTAAIAFAFWLGSSGSSLGGVLAATAAMVLHMALVVPVVSALGTLAAARAVGESEPFARLLTGLASMEHEHESRGEGARIEHAEFCSRIKGALEPWTSQPEPRRGVLGRVQGMVFGVVWSRIRRVLVAELRATTRPGSRSVEEWATIALGMGLDRHLARGLRVGGLRGLAWTSVVLSSLTIIAAKAASMLP